MTVHDVQATGVHFTMGNDFSLGDLMKLGLHQYVDACSEIVDRASKELTIENGLKRIEDTWASLNLSFAPYQVEHASTGPPHCFPACLSECCKEQGAGKESRGSTPPLSW